MVVSSDISSPLVVVVGAKLLVWSGLEDVAKGSGGIYTHLHHFYGKAQITVYAHSQLPTVDVQAGFYMTTSQTPWSLCASSKTDIPVPYIDVAHDYYGLFVRYAIESPEYRTGGKAIHSYGEVITHAEAVAAIERVRNTKVAIKPLPMLEYLDQLKAIGAPDLVLIGMADMSNFMIDFGYYFHKDSAHEQQNIRKELARRPRTFEEFLKDNPEILKA